MQSWAFCRRTGIAESTFGRQAVNDGKLCVRLRNGKDVTLDTAAKIRGYIDGQIEQASPTLNGTEHLGQSINKGTTTMTGNTKRKATKNVSEPADSSADRPFRFYDNRQKYLAFVNTTNEKWKVAQRATRELALLKPNPPALRVFDAGMGDATVLSHIMRAMHKSHPIMPFLIVGKEISLEDVRLSLEKLPDRLIEHPASVIVITNLYYAEAPWLRPRDVQMAAALNWREVALEGGSAYEYGEQLRSLDSFLVDGWQVKSSEKTGNPMYVRPSVLVIYRKDHSFLLDGVIPKPGQFGGNYDLVLASQPWRARMSAEFKAKKVLAPLVRSLGPAGRLLAVLLGLALIGALADQHGLGTALTLTAAFFLAFIPQFLDPVLGNVAAQFALLGFLSVLLNTLADAAVAFAAGGKRPCIEAGSIPTTAFRAEFHSADRTRSAEPMTSAVSATLSSTTPKVRNSAVRAIST